MVIKSNCYGFLFASLQSQLSLEWWMTVLNKLR